ncbi:hypothetical protein [Streptomyces sp. JB150]|uniref:hypothetical protein n=1 Tax=Streptomyces sp. JB150 TaxID=2714844 RepID=UPI00140B1FAC|nr:hypothetical protein [Streptomyces sp. JB150]QIJ62554.1 hypothetical protein G7Z13_11280 [Streptomyces sp. JB150]
MTRIGGARVSIHIGDLVEDDEDVYKVRPEAFEPVEEYMAKRRARRAAPTARRGVEQATANPGEQRTVTRPPARRGRGKGGAQEGDKQ